MPTIAQSMPKLQSLFDQLTALPLSPEKVDVLIAKISQAAAAVDGADFSCAIDPMFRLAEAKETRAFEPLCALLLTTEVGGYGIDADNVITEILPGILVALYDGNAALLSDIVLHAEVDDYIRSSALTALVELVREGRAERADAERTLMSIPGTSPDPSSVLWPSWTGAIAALGLHEFVPLVERTLTGADIEDAEETLKDFREDLATMTNDANAKLDGAIEFKPFTTAAAARARTKELSEIFDKLSALLTEARAERATDRAALTVRRASTFEEYGYTHFEPATNTHRNVGRNDPCPCGSGKKHKKCCLN